MSGRSWMGVDSERRRPGDGGVPGFGEVRGQGPGLERAREHQGLPGAPQSDPAGDPALQEYRNLRFYESDDENIVFYGKRSADGANVILVGVNLDPFEPHEARVQVPLSELGIGPEERFQVYELITDHRHPWKGETHTVRLDPQAEPAAIFRLHRFPHKEYGTPCF